MTDPATSTQSPARVEPAATVRAELVQRLSQADPFDLLVIGGGATGLSVALDAAVRGHRVALLESHDFAEGTSSKATKLLHGGVRYLAQGNVHLVREALRERTALMRNAPHLAAALAFVMPAYRLWERPLYGFGLRLYDALAGTASIAPTRSLSRLQTLQALPAIRPQGLIGGVQFWDAQFDDARLAIALARTASRHGALVLNRVEVSSLLHDNGRVSGVQAIDRISGRSLEVRARCVVNATGVWVDHLRQLDGGVGPSVAPIVRPSQGVHLVLDAEVLSGKQALLVPRTADGRVMFAVPWLGKTILGTTDTPTASLDHEPRPLHEEVEFLLREAAHCLTRPPTRADVRSIWVGLRPLVAATPGAERGATGRISREHTVLVSASGLVTVTGGKWTTCRAMAEDVLACCERAQLLPARAAGATRTLPLVGAGNASSTISLADEPGLHLYGDEAPWVAQLPGAHSVLAPGLSEAMVRFAARHEYALTVGDVLARRSRLLFLDAALAERAAARVAALLQEETGIDPQLETFLGLARQYLDVP